MHDMMETQHAESFSNKPKTMKVGDGTPGPGRPKGLANAVTRTIREAVEKAARDCHPAGLAGWLIERANGGIQDRQIFATVVNKAMPLQVQASVNGGVKLELSWLGARDIGATTAQIPQQQSQVIEMEADSAGVLRIKDQASPAEADTAAAPAAQKAAGGAET